MSLNPDHLLLTAVSSLFQVVFNLTAPFTTPRVPRHSGVLLRNIFPQGGADSELS